MHELPKRKWYQKKRYMIPILGFVGLYAFGNFSSTPVTESVIVPQVQEVQGETFELNTEVLEASVTNTPASAVEITPTVPETYVPVKKSVPTPSPYVEEEPELSNDNYYTNVDGDTVHSPAYADEEPSGATARCRDGTYSFSQNRRGTCSHHGGVAEWLY